MNMNQEYQLSFLNKQIIDPIAFSGFTREKKYAELMLNVFIFLLCYQAQKSQSLCIIDDFLKSLQTMECNFVFNY